MSDPDTSLVLFRRIRGGLDRERLQRFARTLRRRVAREDFTCLITGNAELRRLNRQFRGKDHPTDVLSFIGEMAISAGRARAQAAQFGHSVEEEIEILMLHGLLHLNGMDHETDRGQMRRAEQDWRKRLKLPAALTERRARPRPEGTRQLARTKRGPQPLRSKGAR